jgi:hypothetical protein
MVSGGQHPRILKPNTIFGHLHGLNSVTPAHTGQDNNGTGNGREQKHLYFTGNQDTAA